MFKIFIDGSAGTTGLKIVDRLSGRKDINLITLPEELRKDEKARKDALNSADIAFLCLPDTASIEAVRLVENEKTVIIDTSTAHRTLDGWTYGFSELGFKEELSKSKRIANPGCHASGFLALTKPLVDNGVISKDLSLSCFSLTGYTGGGKNMIADYENADRNFLLDAPRQYGLTQNHKHLPEMKKIAGLNFEPIFCPIVAPFACGMEVTVPLFKKDSKSSIDEIKDIYKNFYNGKIVKYIDESENGFLSSNLLAGYDGMQISVFGNQERMILTARFDNLGKGASGSAIQNMNIVMGIDETTGLVL